MSSTFGLKDALVSGVLQDAGVVSGKKHSSLFSLLCVGLVPLLHLLCSCVFGVGVHVYMYVVHEEVYMYTCCT